MITTPNDFLVELSQMLNETSTDVSTKRVGYFNRAMRRVKRVRKWSWNKKTRTLTVLNAVQEYALATAIPDYNPMWGIYEVYIGGEKASPIDYTQKLNTTGLHFYLNPSIGSIGFTHPLNGTESIVIWYSPKHTNAVTKDSTLDPEIPEDMLGPVCLLMQALVHTGKRQRNDARNALLDYKEEIDEAVLQDASNKAKDLPQTIPTPLTYNKVRRVYRY